MEPASDNTVSFLDCLMACANTPELVAEFDRLNGTNLTQFNTRSGLDAMIDDATGRDDDALSKFVEFVHDCVWLPFMAKQ